MSPRIAPRKAPAFKRGDELPPFAVLSVTTETFRAFDFVPAVLYGRKPSA